MYYVYILKSIKYDKLYTGSTKDLKKRLVEHNLGKVQSTKPYLPWRLIYYEGHIIKSLAIKTELFYKTGQGRRQINKKLGLD